MIDTGVSSEVTDNWLPQISDRLQLIVDTSTALFSLPGPELLLAQPIAMFNALEPAAAEEFVTPIVLHTMFTIGIVGVLLLQ